MKKQLSNKKRKKEGMQQPLLGARVALFEPVGLPKSFKVFEAGMWEGTAPYWFYSSALL